MPITRTSFIVDWAQILAASDRSCSNNFSKVGSPAYTPREKLALWRGMWSPYSHMIWNQMLDMDVRAAVPTLRIPVYFLHGAFDYTLAYPMAKEYFATLAAPVKGLYTFPDSAHSPLFEEPERARRVLRDDVLAHAHALAGQL